MQALVKINGYISDGAKLTSPNASLAAQVILAEDTLAQQQPDTDNSCVPQVLMSQPELRHGPLMKPDTILQDGGNSVF